MEFWLDTRYDPLVLHLLPAEYTYETLDEQMTRVEQYYRDRFAASNDEQMGAVMDLSLLQQTNAKNRQRIGACFRALGEVLPGHVVGHAIIVNSGAARFALEGIFWFNKPAWPIKVFTNHNDAVGWTQERFEEHGISIRHPPPWWDPAPG